MEIPENDDILNNAYVIEEPVERAIIKYSNHPSVSKMNETNTKSNIFYIAKTSEVNVKDIILDLDVNKATSKDGIPIKLLPENFDILSPILCNNFNTGVDNNTFPPTLKLAEINRYNKENYSLLPVVV